MQQVCHANGGRVPRITGVAFDLVAWVHQAQAGVWACIMAKTKGAGQRAKGWSVTTVTTSKRLHSDLGHG
jgi:hypothetical protein